MAKSKHEKDVDKTVAWAEEQSPASMTHEITPGPQGHTFTNTLPKMTHKANTTAKSFTAPKADKGGRPTKFEARFSDMAKKACSLGATSLDLAELFGVTESTIYEWIKKSNPFSKAIEAGKAMIDTMVERSLLNRALGCSVKETKVFCSEGSIVTEEVDKYFPPDVAAQKHWLNNRKPKEWRDKREVDFTSPLSIVMGDADQDTL